MLIIHLGELAFERMKVIRIFSIVLKLQNQIDFFWILQKKILEKLAERAGRILTCRLAERPWALKVARWKKTTTTDRGESRPHCRAARAGKLQSSECGPVEHVVVSKHLMCIARIFFSSSGRESRSSGKAAVELVVLSACEQLQFYSDVKLALHLIQTFMSKGSMSLNRKIQQWLPFYNRYIITHHISAWNVITYHIW